MKGRKRHVLVDVTGLVLAVRVPAADGQARRLSKEYERLPATSEAMIYAAMTRLMLRRLARAVARV